ncbi:hypothetical protein ENUP19_0085G0071 [Entamoeba nuttalli]|uniref:Importin subunit alpha n=2 Tax=Entamoeba nuttalli TaxID=412467 RepID=K2GU65_ENTNP|nr:hypothetical protein ENU1_162570 [Entamoeba nuttalli P19]EKE38573.1 hypothetical protein ENU1_162570 [Entamoeba nuttalli P19]|eukprot:XP_008859100.1 hypothetical protein ENU1_162570 [Entamoeba nuttalli P19]
MEQILKDKQEVRNDMRRSRRREMMEQKRNQISSEVVNVPILPTIEVISQQCNDVMNQGNLSLIPTLRSYLSNESLQQSLIIKSGIIPYLVRTLPNMETVSLLNTLFLLNDFCSLSEECSKHLLDSGFNSHVHLLLQSDNISIVISTIYILSNISAFDELKLIISQLNVINIYSTLFQKYKSDKSLQHAMSWLFLNMCRGSIINYNEVSQYIQYFLVQVNDIYDVDSVSDALWAFYYVSSKPKFSDLIDNDIVYEKVIQYLPNDNIKLSIPSVKIANNMIVKNEFIVEKMISYGILDILKELTKKNQNDQISDVYQILSNIAACENIEIIKQFESSGFIELLIHSYEDEERSFVKENIEWTLANYIYGCSNELLSLTLQKSIGILPILIQILQNHMTEIKKQQLISITLKGILNILKFADEVNLDLTSILEQFYFENICEDLSLSSKNSTVRKRAQFILDNYFAFDDDEL